MLVARVASSDATINNFKYLASLRYIPGEQTRLVITLIQEDKDNLRYMVPDVGTVSVMLSLSDGSTLTKTMSPLSNVSPAGTDRSTWFVDLEETETADLLGGNFLFMIDVLGNASEIIKGWVQNGLSRIITGAC